MKKLLLRISIFLSVVFLGTACSNRLVEEQTTSKVFMVKPVNFGFNEQTASNNVFQVEGYNDEAQVKALNESQNYVKQLKENGIDVIYVEDTNEPRTPDSIFPNNWFSTHKGGTLVLYPMNAPNRRAERKEVFIDAIKENSKIEKTLDLSHWENEDLFLEGTGAMIFDRENHIVYACKSPRMHEKVLDDFCNQMGYKKVVFSSVDKNGQSIYHTNVMLCLGKTFAVICLDSITDENEKNAVVESLNKTNKKIIQISLDQMENFVGNMLELKNKNNERILVMSDRAYNNLNNEQKEYLESECKIIHPDLKYIELNGGGSARCMLGEIFE